MTLSLIFLLLPLGAGAIAGIGALGGLLSNGINAVFQGKANKESWRRAQESYARERADNLSDWTRQNAYNHPTEQMKRMREAGLNPAMMYGGGQGVTTAQPVKNASQESPQVSPVSIELGGIVQQFLASMQMQQQTDNLREINEMLKLQQQGQNLKNVLTDIGISRQDRALRMDDLKLGVMPKQLEYSLQAMKLKNAMTGAQTDYILNEDQRRIALTAQSLKEGVARLLQYELQRAKTKAETAHIRKQIQNLDKDINLKGFEEKLNQDNISKSDPAYLRILNQVFHYFMTK